MRKMHSYHVYILTNWKRTVLYTGVTNNIMQRLKEHYDNRGKPRTFAGKFYCYNLIYLEWHKYINDAIAREKEIKSWRRELKIELIQQFNPEMKFLNTEVCGEWPPTYEGRL